MNSYPSASRGDNSINTMNVIDSNASVSTVYICGSKIFINILINVSLWK